VPPASSAPETRIRTHLYQMSYAHPDQMRHAHPDQIRADQYCHPERSEGSPYQPDTPGRYFVALTMTSGEPETVIHDRK